MLYCLYLEILGFLCKIKKFFYECFLIKSMQRANQIIDDAIDRKNLFAFKRKTTISA